MQGLPPIDQVEARYEEVGRRLAEPGVARDPARLRALGREHQELGRVVDLARRLARVEGELQDARALADGGDDGEIRALARQELEALAGQKEALGQALSQALTPRDPNDTRNVVLELRSGTGGDEAALFCGELFRLYSRLAESRGWRVEVLSSSPGAHGGLREVIALVEGADAYAWLRYESGVHRVQRVPATEAQGRIHTSAVTVAVLPEAEEIEVTLDERDLKIDVYRSSGPGGQSVNTTDSAVRVRHLPSGLVVTCQDEKSQHKNRAKALKILRARLLDQQTAAHEAELARERRSMVKSGDRSDKIRTYNFPQDRLTDHRIGLTVHNLPRIMQGEIEVVIEAVRAHLRALALEGREG